MSDRPKAPGVTYALVAVALLIMLTTFALVQRQPPPPTIAEFAPQAVENITDAPSDQSSSSGRVGGAGFGGGGGAAVASLGPQAPIDVPRVRRCVGDPPRQIEDPQSPPCVPYWAGDNGGSTSKGVTRDEVRIAAPGNWGSAFQMAAFFNKRFEFYGRTLHMVDPTHAASCDDPPQRAAAVTADEAMRVFASLYSQACEGFHYAAELVRRKIIVSTVHANYTEGYMRERAPYLWQYPMAADRLLTAIGEATCARLAGRNSRFAGDPTLVDKPRVFGMIFTTVAGAGEDYLTTDALERRLRACGVEAAVKTRAGGTNTILQMRSSNVSTVLCVCNYADYVTSTRDATSQGYLPEWVVSTYGEADKNVSLNIGFGGGGKEQLAHTMGITVQPRQRRATDEPSYWALHETDPTRVGDDVSTNRSAHNDDYHAMLLLASGIQMAGPRLTPQSFEEALQRTVFPNPESPLQTGKVGFAGRLHSMTLDAAEFWWSNDSAGPYADKGNGTICYVDGGTRRVPGAWPTGEAAFFQPPCDAA